LPKFGPKFAFSIERVEIIPESVKNRILCTQGTI
jgi:hypothetical protein